MDRSCSILLQWALLNWMIFCTNSSFSIIAPTSNVTPGESFPSTHSSLVVHVTRKLKGWYKGPLRAYELSITSQHKALLVTSLWVSFYRNLVKKRQRMEKYFWKEKSQSRRLQKIVQVARISADFSAPGNFLGIWPDTVAKKNRIFLLINAP